MSYRQKHFLAIEGLHPPEIGHLLDLAESSVLLNRSGKMQRDVLRGRTLRAAGFADAWMIEDLKWRIVPHGRGHARGAGHAESNDASLCQRVAGWPGRRA